MSARRRLAVILIAACASACGRKGPPLAPLHLIPVAPANISVGRTGDEAQIRFDVPATNVNGPGPVALDRIEVFAATVAAGAVRPANRELLVSKYRVATIAIKPPPVEGEPPPESAPEDKRPSAGEKTTFVEELTAERLKPVFTTLPKQPATPAAASPSTQTGTPTAAQAGQPTTGAAPGAAGVTPVAEPTVPAAPGAAGVLPVTQPAAPGAAGVETVQVPDAAALPGTPTPLPQPPGSATDAAIAPVPPLPPLPNYPARLYVVRGVTKSGRPGPPSTRLELPLVAPPAAPPVPAATSTETSIILTWSPPPSETPIAYNIYKAGSADPINPTPVAAGKFERAGVTFGTEECFTLRAIEKVANISLESTPSDAVCLTPRDTFAPGAPKGFSIVAGSGTMNLGWDANAEADLAGYLVLRGEAPGDTLQPLTPSPISATSYEDKTVKPGVRYVYAIIAVDKATPPNRSAPSARLEETAR
jgi:fibronectin type 3 domain-containing protein